jgi:hypothetical protein
VSDSRFFGTTSSLRDIGYVTTSTETPDINHKCICGERGTLCISMPKSKLQVFSEVAYKHLNQINEPPSQSISTYFHILQLLLNSNVLNVV